MPPTAAAKPASYPTKRVEPKRSEALEAALAEADSLRGRRDLEALEAFRRLGDRHPEDPKVLEGWSRVAASTKWWGESLEVAKRWATVDPTPAGANPSRADAEAAGSNR